MNIGPAEIIVVLVIALLVFGPKRLPQMGRSLGRAVREFQNAAATARSELGLDDVLSQVNDVKNDVSAAVGLDELKASAAGVKSSLGVDEITKSIDDVKSGFKIDLKGAPGEPSPTPAPDSTTQPAAAEPPGSAQATAEPDGTVPDASHAAGSGVADEQPSAADSVAAEAPQPWTESEPSQSSGGEDLPWLAPAAQPYGPAVAVEAPATAAPSPPPTAPEAPAPPRETAGA